MSFGSQHDIGAKLAALRAADNAALTAAGAGDNTQIVGQIIDRTQAGVLNFPLSAIAYASWKAVLAAAQTLTFKSVIIEHGNDPALADAATFASFSDVLVGTGAATLRGAQEYKVDLAGAKQYVRIKLTPDLSAASIDTAEVAIVWVFGGADTDPV